MKEKTLKYYYTALACLTFVFAITTVMIGGQQISTGQEIAKLEKQQSSIQTQKEYLQQQLAEQLSIAQLTQHADLQAYQPIKNVVQVKDSNALALR